MEYRKKLTAALSLFLVCVLLMLYTTYAWLVVSIAPEVSSIETNVGANGSLEVALLNEETFLDPSAIRTAPGSSMVIQDPKFSNITWGNVIDLSPEDYGLQEISLRPSRLNLTADQQGNYVVGNNLLMLAAFGSDGRVTFITDDTDSGVFENQKFWFNLDRQSYGVRGIGMTNNVTVRQRAIVEANTLIPMYNASAIRTVQNIFQENGASLLLIKEGYIGDHWDDRWYSEAQHDLIMDANRKMQTAYDYVDKALRYSILGFSASVITDDVTFNRLYDAVITAEIPLGSIAENLPINMDLLFPGFQTYLQQVDSIRESLQHYNCDTGDTDWECSDAYWSLEGVIPESAYLNNIKLEDVRDYTFKGDNILAIRGTETVGLLASYVGNFETFFGVPRNGEIFDVEVQVSHQKENENLPLIPYLSEKLTGYIQSSDALKAEISDVYGFAIDMAFRCNSTTELLLQTDEMLRVQESTELPVTQGGGSYVRFRSDNMSREQLIPLIDTIRLGFVDNQNHLVALAKPDVSNYKEDIDGSITAPLYLHEYMLTPNGVIVPGERRNDDASILPLHQNMPEHLTAILWMDGDYVDNSMVSIINKAMTGVVNLQFSSSVDLRPSDISIESRD